jgi:hypothetical protein
MSGRKLEWSDEIGVVLSQGVCRTELDMGRGLRKSGGCGTALKGRKIPARGVLFAVLLLFHPLYRPVA